MKVKEVLDYNRTIRLILDNVQDVNALLKFRMLGMLKQFEPIVANFEQVRSEKIMQYGTVGEDGVLGIFKPREEEFGSIDEYNAEMQKYQDTIRKISSDIDEVLTSDIDIQIKKFKYTDIVDADIPTDYLVAIYNLIEE